jgi:hypothetical protein
MNRGEEEHVHVVGGKARRKEVVRKTKTQVVDTIRLDLLELGWCDVDWIGLAQDRNRWRALVNSVLNLRVPYNAGKLWGTIDHYKVFFMLNPCLSLIGRHSAS